MCDLCENQEKAKGECPHRMLREKVSFSVFRVAIKYHGQFVSFELELELVAEISPIE